MRLSRPTLVGLLLLALTAAPAAAAPPARDAAAKAEHERIVRFWTPARMAAAKPRDFVRTPTGFKPAAKPEKPPGGGGGGGGAKDVTGASWTKGGDVSRRVGKVFFRMGSSYYTCSGSVANDNRSDVSLVLTAAHCAYDEVGGAFATEWMFIPAWGSQPATRTTACSQTKYGCWTANALVVHNGYASAGSFNTQATVHDYAFAVVGAGGKGGSVEPQLDAAVGSYPISFSSLNTGWRAQAFGYPASGKYKGNTLTWCAGNTITDVYNANLTWGVGCDMTGGSSGGPWFRDLNEGTGNGGTLSSLNSYGYSGIRNMYGPKFDATTQAVYNTANSATSSTVVGAP
jgi:hypothetical protein